MNSEFDRLKNIAESVRALFQADHTLTLGDMDALAAQHGSMSHEVQMVIAEMTTFGTTVGSLKLKPCYQQAGSDPPQIAELDA